MAATEGVLRIVRRHFPNVNKVEEAKHPLVVEVTRGDVKSSKRKDMSHCAMAQACKRVFHADGVIMARSIAYLVKGDLAIRYGVPNTVTREITAFDRGGDFEPGIYSLVPKTKGMTLEHKVKMNKAEGGNKPNKGIRKYHHTTGIRAVLGSLDDKG